MPKKLPSIEYLHKALYYDPHKGEFFWRERTPDMFLHKGALSADRKCNHWNSMPTRGHSHEAGSSMAASTGYRAKWRMLRGLWHEAFGPARRA
mgnify:CR=1 FL=1